MAQVAIGEGRNEIHLGWQQLGTYFTVDEDERLWLVDAEDGQVKAFDKQGQLIYIVPRENPGMSVDRVHVYKDYLITLSEGILFFHNKYNGKLLREQKLDVENAIYNQAYFFSNYLYLPQHEYGPIQNLYKFVFETKTTVGDSLNVNIHQLDLIPNARGIYRSRSIFPIDSCCYTVLKDMDWQSFKGQSENYVLIMTEVGTTGKEEDCYYVLRKKDHLIKRIGKIPESITGLVANYGWGESSVIVGNVVYLMGVKYQDMKHGYHDPQKIIISKINLSNIDKLPSVPVEEIKWKQ
jgi:hypothetical protein